MDQYSGNSLGQGGVRVWLWQAIVHDCKPLHRPLIPETIDFPELFKLSLLVLPGGRVSSHSGLFGLGNRWSPGRGLQRGWGGRGSCAMERLYVY